MTLETYSDSSGRVFVSETQERLLTLDASLSLIKREQGREAQSLLKRAYGCYCARVVTRTDKMLKSALEGANVNLALSTAKRDAGIYLGLALRGIVKEGKITERYEGYLDSIASVWDKLTLALKIPIAPCAPADEVLLARLAKKSDLNAIVRYNKDSATINKVTADDCIKCEGDKLVFVLPERVQAWLQTQANARRRDVTSGEIGAAVGVLLSAVEHKSEQAIEALHLLASRAGYQLIAVAPAPEPDQDQDQDQEQEQEQEQDAVAVS